MGICRTADFYRYRGGHYAGHRIKFSGVKTGDRMNRGRNEAEDRVVSRVYMNMILDEWKKMGADLKTHINSFLKNEIDIKELKRLMGEKQLVFMALMYGKALEEGNEKEMALWGEKIETYCIQKPKQTTESENPGANRFMESLANYVEKQLLEPARLPEPKK